MRMPTDPLSDSGSDSGPDSGSDSGAASAASEATSALVTQLAEAFREQVRRAIDCELDWSETSLAFVDHYLTLARDETREAILTLLAGGAGAYFGEVVRREIGATWIGDGRDPRRLRLLLSPQLIHFAPVDLAFEAIRRGEEAGGETGVLDTAFRLDDKAPPPEEGPDGQPRQRQDDASWVDARLSELPPVASDLYYSLTGRFETLKLILELLATKHASEGRRPTTYALSDYVEALVQDA
jgi:hypothetical protein